MGLKLTQFVLAAVLLRPTLAAVHQWPNPALDALEHQRWDQQGFNHNSLVSFVAPCDQFAFSNPSLSGHRTNAADWLRTAYHDMANADTQSGIGGIDASIQFAGEQSRPENAGDSFSNTIAVVRAVANRHVSLADAIALGAVVAVEQCGGPEIPFRGGRVDAKEAGPPGVPEPEQDLASHTANFARQGFSAKEMIQLIACGHSFGGVQRKFFPNVVSESEIDPQTNPQGNTHFDSTFAFFDNTIATEYLSGTTKNPLVTGFNVTTRSDLRIFSSDGNVTMKAFAASNDHFLSSCASMFERMLNTVPRGVQLSEIIEPLPAKPHELTLMRITNGSFNLQGEFRLWNMQESDDLQVNFSWVGDASKTCEGCSIQLSHEARMETVTTPGNLTSLWFSLPEEGLLIGSSSIFKFWLDVNQYGKSRKEDQNGLGFPLQTNVVVSSSSCAIVVDDFNLIGMRVDIAVKKGQAVTAVWVEADGFDENGRNFPQVVSTFVAQRNQTASTSDAEYDIYSATINDHIVLSASDMNVAATIDGKTVRDWTIFRSGQFDNC